MGRQTNAYDLGLGDNPATIKKKQTKQKTEPSQEVSLGLTHAMNVAKVCGLLSGLDQKLGSAIEYLTDARLRVFKVLESQAVDDVIPKGDVPILGSIEELISVEILPPLKDCRTVSMRILKSIAAQEKEVRDEQIKQDAVACPEI